MRLHLPCHHKRIFVIIIPKSCIYITSARLHLSQISNPHSDRLTAPTLIRSYTCKAIYNPQLLVKEEGQPETLDYSIFLHDQSSKKHVVRKNKIGSMECNKTSIKDAPNSGIYNAVESATTGDSDQNGKQTRKRNDRDGDDEQESSDDNEHLSTRKRARVVWSLELHRKFVSVANQLGIDSVPKRHAFGLIAWTRNDLLNRRYMELFT